MQKCVKYTHLSRELWLLYSGSAMFDLYDVHGSLKTLIDKLLDASREGYTTVRDTFLVLAGSGNAARRYFGFDVAELPTSTELDTFTTPAKLEEMREAVISAIMLGNGREIESENEEIDLGLMELEANSKKKHT